MTIMTEMVKKYSERIFELQNESETLEEYLLWNHYERILIEYGVKALPRNIQKLLN